MKKLIFLFSLLFLFALGCTDEDTPMIQQLQEKNQLEPLYAKNSKTVTIPFKANFYTEKDVAFTGEYDCPEGSGPNHQVGKGEGTHLGTFYADMTFCGSPDFTYGNGLGKFIAANGDELYYEIVTGVVEPIVHPFYEAFFDDEFSFIGGTGRFEGATGGGVTYSFVDLFTNGWPPAEGTTFIDDHRTDHLWTGTLTLTPGSRSK